MIAAFKIRSVSDPSTLLGVVLSRSKGDGTRAGVGPRAKLQEMTNPQQRIVLVAPNWLGDIAMSLPAMRDVSNT